MFVGAFMNRKIFILSKDFGSFHSEKSVLFIEPLHRTRSLE